MKKALLITVLASVLVMALGFGMASAQEPVTLVYWSMWNETEGQARVLQAAIASFEAANPNVTIDAVWNGRQNQTLVRTAISGGNQVIDLMQDPQNGLPPDLRASIVSVGMAVQREMQSDTPDFEFLIAVNEDIAAGLAPAGLVPAG